MFASEFPLRRASVRPLLPGEECPRARPATREAESLANAKRKVPSVNERAWKRVVRSPTRRPFVISRAYHKMVEIQTSCVLPLASRSLHLCEAPGGFVKATSENVHDGWEWMAVSLPDAILFDEPNLPQGGKVLYGDVRDDAWVSETLPAEWADLVTCDGAVEMDHERLEEAHLPLLECETRVGLRSLKLGGTMVIKFFEGSLAETRLWIARMTTRFRSVSIIKPYTSRPTNSERYLVCLDKVADPEEWETLRVVAEAWDADLDKVLGRLDENQTSAILSAIQRATV